MRAFSLDLEIQKNYTALRETGLKVAEKLLDQPDGAYAIIYDYAHWVSPIGNKLELIYSPDLDLETGVLHIDRGYFDEMRSYLSFDYDPYSLENDTNETLIKYEKAMQEWLTSPVYRFFDQDILDKVSLTGCIDEIVTETQTMIQSLKENMELEKHIANNNSQAMIRF